MVAWVTTRATRRSSAALVGGLDRPLNGYPQTVTPGPGAILRYFGARTEAPDLPATISNNGDASDFYDRFGRPQFSDADWRPSRIWRLQKFRSDT